MAVQLTKNIKTSEVSENLRGLKSLSMVLPVPLESHDGLFFHPHSVKRRWKVVVLSLLFATLRTRPLSPP
jgi:hypothetical protein